MTKTCTLRVIAHIESAFTEKFGIPRQSGLADAVPARIVFEPPYRVPAAFRGLERYSHLWLLWQFSQAQRPEWSPTVRPPRLGGNARVGVFATRSPYRPNPIGLSCVRLSRIEQDKALGPVLHVLGADLLNGSPIFDIKPYVPYADAHPEASPGFSGPTDGVALQVDFPPELLCRIPEPLRAGLIQALSQDPRPRYQHEPQRLYKMAFAGFDVHFVIDQGRLTVRDVVALTHRPDK